MSGLFSGFKKKDNTPLPVPEEPVPVRDEFGEMKERVHLGAARMKPHYIGNVLSALYYLCDADPEKAQETILALSSYLRQNVEGINRLELLPFSWELDHAQHYIALEELRFEDRLLARADVEWDEFELPPLTLQPLVENAIKHGLAPLDRPCTISISTRRTMDGQVELQVSDDGAGFDPSILQNPEMEEKSLACIRRRLSREVGGRMQIESTPGRGTIVTITVPLQK